MNSPPHSLWNGRVAERVLQPARFAVVYSLVLLLAIFTNAQDKSSPAHKQNARPAQSGEAAKPTEANKPDTEPVKYSYEFSQPEFYIPHIFIEHDTGGRGQITFKRLNEETSIVEPLEISAAAWGRISQFWQTLRFLDSDVNYQSSKQFPHLGTMRITMQQGTRKRVAEFNWTNNTDASHLVDEYRRLADQAIFVFDVSVARENQPLNTPKLMDQLESMLKRNWLSDPQQLTPLLKDISTDEHLPLIARNHALRLLKTIEK
jgi:hypothetical protein